MTIKEKIALLKKNPGNIFLIKGGKIIVKNHHCYRVPKIITNIFKIYYFSGAGFYALFAIVYFVPDFLNNFYIRFCISLCIYLSIEILLFFLVPIKKHLCWQIQ